MAIHRIEISTDDMKTIKYHYYAQKAITSDSMLDLMHDIIEQLAEK